MKTRAHTEAASNYRNLEHMSVAEILLAMNAEDQKVAHAVGLTLEPIRAFVEQLIPKVKKGGRLFYIGAGTSGRLGIIDASECPPTFGVGPDVVIGLIAGGDGAIRKAVEFAEDSETQAWEDLSQYSIGSDDTVVGIAASGTTPYVVFGLMACQNHGITTACICSNPDSPVTKFANYPIVVDLGPEFLTGSTRLKSGSAQKMILNMISTALMIGLGRVKDHKMVDMQLSNQKLLERGTAMIQEALQISKKEAQDLLLKFGSVRAVLDSKK